MKLPFALKKSLAPRPPDTLPTSALPNGVGQCPEPGALAPQPAPSAVSPANGAGYVWELTATPCSQAAPLSQRAAFLDHARPLLERYLAAHPAATQVTWDIPLLGRITGRHVEGRAAPTGEVTLRFVPSAPLYQPDTNPAPPGEGFGLMLPQDGLAQQGARLVGLSTIAAEVLLDIGLRAGGGAGLREWARRTGVTLPGPLLTRYQSASAVFLFEGLPGTGKSALSRALADNYCREHGVDGVLHEVDTRVRGDGTVGDFSARIRAAFSAFQQSAAPAKFLVIDEVDAIAARRSGADQHQEDRAATATLLQLLDGLATCPVAHPAGVMAVFLTTNRVAALDPALRRRLSGTFTFGPLPLEARYALIAAWFVDFSERDLHKATAAAAGMSPADIENAMLGLFRAALCQKTAPTPRAVQERLRDYPRTEPV